MPKITITFEDAPDGRVVITGDPPIDVITEQAGTEGQLTGAAKWAAAAWLLLHRMDQEQHPPRIQH